MLSRPSRLWNVRPWQVVRSWVDPYRQGLRRIREQAQFRAGVARVERRRSSRVARLWLELRQIAAFLSQGHP